MAANDAGVTVLPDGSAFSVVSFALPGDHWLYAEGHDEPPMPLRIGQGEERDVLAAHVRAAARYAVRGATMRGTATDFDPDALVQNMIVGLLGYWTEDGRSIVGMRVELEEHAHTDASTLYAACDGLDEAFAALRALTVHSSESKMDDPGLDSDAHRAACKLIEKYGGVAVGRKEWDDLIAERNDLRGRLHALAVEQRGPRVDAERIAYSLLDAASSVIRHSCPSDPTTAAVDMAAWMNLSEKTIAAREALANPAVEQRGEPEPYVGVVKVSYAPPSCPSCGFQHPVEQPSGFWITMKEYNRLIYATAPDVTRAEERRIEGSVIDIRGSNGNRGWAFYESAATPNPYPYEKRATLIIIEETEL